MKSLSEVEVFCDGIGSDKQDVVVKPKKIRSHRLFWEMVGTGVISFVLGSVLFIPLFNNRTGYDILIERIGSSSKTVGNSSTDDEVVIPEPYLYEEFIKPSNSFGLDNTTFKSVNWSYFKQLFNAHTQWSLEYDIGQGWQNGNQYLGVDKTWNETLGGWKINLTFTNPSSMNVKARFTFACDLVVLDFVERDGTQVNLNYTVPGTDEVYNVFFNWSDLQSYPGLWFNKGRTDDLFWFRFGHDSVPPGVYVFDPMFGYNTASSGTLGYERVIKGLPAECPSSGTADEISVFIYSDTYVGNVVCGIYNYDAGGDLATTLVGQTETKAVSTGNGWQTFDFSEPKPTLVGGTTYVLATWGSLGDGNLKILYLYDVDYDIGITKYLGTSPGDLPSPLEGESQADHIYWITCNYTESAGESWSNVCPVASGEQPSNSSTDISLVPACGVFITDGNSNHTMNCTFATNESGDWVNKQTNTSVANNTGINWTYNSANTQSTKYYWRIYVHDGICNQSFTYSFTTKANVSEGTWQSVDSTFNGNYTNSSHWTLLDDTINGTFYDSHIWNTVDDTVNGLFYNETKNILLDDSINGIYTNSTYWELLDDTINGIYINTSHWTLLDDTINGTFYDSHTWNTVDDSINGLYYNETKYILLDDTINGVYHNSTFWEMFNDSINGFYFNTSHWTLIDDTINGLFYNESKWNSFDDSINGLYYNLSDKTVWQSFDDTVNGVYTNTSTVWHSIDSSINGRYINYTGNFTTGVIITNRKSIVMFSAAILFSGVAIAVILFYFLTRRKHYARR